MRIRTTLLGSQQIDLATEAIQKGSPIYLPRSQSICHGTYLVSIFNNLVRATDQVQIILPKELSDNVATIGEGHTPVVLSPPVNCVIGVGPNEITQQAGIWYVRWTGDVCNVIQRVQLGAQSSVDTEYLVVYDRSGRKTIEHVGEGPPKLDAVPPLALVVEAVDAIDSGALVISAEAEEVFGPPDFVGKDQRCTFYALLSSGKMNKCMYI